MPQIMAQPMPMELIDRGDAILISIEEYDTLRTIDMNANSPPASPEHTRLGYSVGRWVGETLEVETTGISAQYLSQRGQPLSAATRLRERFTVSDDGSRLHYLLTVTDPENYTAPFDVRRSWIWRPGERVMAYDCAA
jgi:hypothetical protein